VESETLEQLVRRLVAIEAQAKLVGRAPGFLRAIAALPAVARSDGPVLITGETGTGKELIARALHYLGPRDRFPFVPVNCGALVDTLLEDELFGHEPGAFTDARRRRPGLIAQAHRGTLFLDEVDALSRRAQVALLRVLQDRRFRALGSGREERVDVRFIAATNVPLDELVRGGHFRADLYYRLSVFTLRLPPLRERREDVLRLAEHFLRVHAPADRAPLELSAEARAALLAHDWPGNVREIENSIVRAVYTAPRPAIGAGDLGLAPPPAEREPAGRPPGPAAGTFKAMKRLTVLAFERDYLIRLMTEHRGNVSRAARAAGKERRDLGKLLKKHQLDPRCFGARDALAPDRGDAPPPPGSFLTRG
jgi:DNA-binding NtrC family response regulator